MIKISGFYLPFEYLDVLNMKNHSRELGYREPYLIDGVQVKLYESGHVLGGATITVSHENKTIFYTGDINTRGSKLLRPADLNVGEIDYMIIESTLLPILLDPKRGIRARIIWFCKRDNRGWRDVFLFLPFR